MSREVPIRITRIQYWNIPLTIERHTRTAANSKTNWILKPEVSESTPPRITSGSDALTTSFKISDPSPSAMPRR